MKRTPLRLVVAILALAAIAAAAVSASRLPRAAEQPAPRTSAARRARRDWLRRFATRRFNPLVTRLGLVGGRRSPWALLEHVGRRSGRVYRTPVLPLFIGDFAYVPLQFGTDADWARNVRAAGTCRLQVHEHVYELDEPAEIGPAEHPGVPESLRPWVERRGRRYLRLHVLSATPGRLDRREARVPADTVLAAAEPAEALRPAEALPAAGPPKPAEVQPAVRARSRAAALAPPTAEQQTLS
jgi:deazaflavin-dependent oxidoreductase (nitroreductase family)